MAATAEISPPISARTPACTYTRTLRALRRREYGGDAEGDTLVKIEDLAGSRYNDELTGNDQANLLCGIEGNDVLTGSNSSDEIGGGEASIRRLPGSSARVAVSLRANTAAGGDADGDQLDNIETSSALPMRIRCRATTKTSASGLGATTRYGYGSEDGLWGGDDDDTLFGGGRRQRVKGFGGDDELDGDDEADCMWAEPAMTSTSSTTRPTW